MASKIKTLLVFEGIKQDLKQRQHASKSKITGLQSESSERHLKNERQTLRDLMSLEAKCNAVFSKLIRLNGPNLKIPEDIRRQIEGIRDMLPDENHKQKLNEVFSL